MFTLTSSLGPKKMTAEKAIPYESGSESTGASHARLSVKFYLTAILFVVFDIEAVFLLPWLRGTTMPMRVVIHQPVQPMQSP